LPTRIASAGASAWVAPDFHLPGARRGHGSAHPRLHHAPSPSHGIGHGVGECMVKIMEEHLVEPVAATQQACHDPGEDGVAAVGVQGQELIPPMRVVEVGEEGPSNGEASAAGHSHRDEESPALRQRPSQRPSSQEPHAGPKGGYK